MGQKFVKRYRKVIKHEVQSNQRRAITWAMNNLFDLPRRDRFKVALQLMFGRKKYQTSPAGREQDGKE